MKKKPPQFPSVLFKRLQILEIFEVIFFLNGLDFVQFDDTQTFKLSFIAGSTVSIKQT